MTNSHQHPLYALDGQAVTVVEAIPIEDPDGRVIGTQRVTERAVVMVPWNALGLRRDEEDDDA